MGSIYFSFNIFLTFHLGIQYDGKKKKKKQEEKKSDLLLIEVIVACVTLSSLQYSFF